MIMKLSDKFEVTYAIPVGSNITNEKIPTNVRIYEFSRSWSTRAWRIQSTMILVGNRSKSSSFGFWLQRAILGNEYWDKRSISFLIGKIRSIAFAIFKNPFFYLALIPPIRYLLVSILKFFLYFKDNTKDYIPKGTHIVVLPSQGGSEWDVEEIIRNCNRANLVCVLAIDNWDNLTSKQVIRFKPTFVTVMGQSAVEQAIKIHGFRRETILPIGLPRFNSYRGVNRIKPIQKVYQNTFRINYLGFSLPYDEVQVINGLVKDLKNLKDPHVEMHYRPHPFRKLRFKESSIDRSVTVYSNDRKGKPENSLPNPSLYKEHIAKFDLIIATPTTMALEVMALGIPCIIDAIDDGVHRSSAGNAFNNYLHMKDLEIIPGLAIAKKYEDLLQYVLQNYNHRQKEIKYDLEKIINLKEETYIEQLIKHLSDIV